MRIISWNVNGLRAILSKTFYGLVQDYDPDILCLQETKVNGDTIPDIGLPQYGNRHFHCAQRRGYSGTAILSRPLLQDLDLYGLPERTLQLMEGRLMAARVRDITLVNVYAPNAQAELRRLDLRSGGWDPLFARYLEELMDDGKDLLVCGDFNVAHRPLDLARPEDNANSAGFTDAERAGFDRYLELGLVDAFRRLHPEERAYSYWSYRLRGREKNIGWRIDYFLLSESLMGHVRDCRILDDVLGSDHAPILLDLDS